jgi:ABC-type antimicrobial peptide transport system permease subunit
MNLGLILKRVRREWRPFGILLISILLVTAFFSLSPLYVRAMVQSGLDLEFESLPDADLTLTSPTPYSAEAWDLVNAQLGALNGGVTRITRTGRAFGGFAYQYGEPTDEFTARSEFGHYLFAFSNMRDLFRVVDGRFPDRLAPPGSPERTAADEQERIDKGMDIYSRGDVEGVVTAVVAQSAGLEIGTRIAVGELPYLRRVIHIVGIVEVVNPDDPIWQTNRIALEGETVQGGGISLQESFNMAVIVPEGAYTDWLVEATRTDAGQRENNSFIWRIRLNTTAINADNVRDVQQRMNTLVSALAAEYPGLLDTNPLETRLDRYLDLVSNAEPPVILLSGAVLVLMLYHLVATVNLVLEGQIGEWASISSRGASTRQLLTMQAFSMLLLCLIGFAAGPVLALGVLHILARVGPLAAVTGDRPIIGGIPPNAFVLSAIAAVLAVIMLTLPAIPAARRSLAQFKQESARPGASPFWARYGLDLILIVLGLAFVARLLFFVGGDFSETLNTLVNSPSRLISLLLESANSTGGLSDPLNLLAPALLLTGAALLWLRIFPLIMHLFGTVARRSGGLTAPLSTWNVERDPGRYAQLVLLLIGTLALGTAALALGATRDAGAWAQAVNETGGAIRLDFTAIPADFDPNSVPNVTGSAQLTRIETPRRAGYTQHLLVGVDPNTLPDVFPETASVRALIGQEVAAERVFDRRSRGFVDDPIYPVIISARMAEDEGRVLRQDDLPLEVGQVGAIELKFADRSAVLRYRIVGIVSDFPTLSANQHFMLFDKAVLAQLDDQAPNQVWLTTPAALEPDAAMRARIAELPELSRQGIAWDRYNVLLREPLPAAVAGMFYAGFWVSLILSLLDFGFYLAMTIRRRSVGFAVLRALGWDARHLWNMLVAEQAALVIPALVVGVLLGVVLAYIVLPFLALVGGSTLQMPLVGLSALLIALLAGFALLSIGAAWYLRRLNVNQWLRVGEE